MRTAMMFLLAMLSTVGNADDIVIRNGVRCYKKRVIIGNCVSYRYTPVPVTPAYKEPQKPDVDYEKLLELPEDQYDREITRIISRAATVHTRKNELDSLVRAGVLPGPLGGYGYPADRSITSRNQYRPSEQSYGIRVKESVDYVGSDPTDIIAHYLGRHQERVDSSVNELQTEQNRQLLTLIASRASNTDRITRALEKQTEAQSRALEIQALGAATNRGSTTRDIQISGGISSLLQQLLSGVTGGNTNPPPLTGTISPGLGNTGASGVQRLINTKCIKCHGENGQSGLDLRNYAQLDLDTTTKVVVSVRGGSMPPASETPLTAEEVGVFTDDFVNALKKE